jgi:hypothetical protein
MIQELRSGCRGARAAPLCTLVVALVIPALAGAAGTGAPRRLIDGATPPALPTALRAQGGALVMTKVRVVRVRQIRRLVSTCVPGERLPAGERVVERIGVNGRSITFLGLGSTIEGCDRNPRATGKIWCGGAGWVWRGGKVSDPRLTVCQDRRGRPVVAFGWINALPQAGWIVVDQPGFREVYPVGGRLPVRVSTVSGIGRGGGAVFRIAQYDPRGVVLERRTVVAAVAG